MVAEGRKITLSADRDRDFPGWYNTIIRQAELIDDRFNIKGMVVYRPLAMKLTKAIYSMFEERLEASGHQPVLFPVLIPEENFNKEAEHIKGFTPETYWVTMGGDETLSSKYALRPTSETAFYFMYSQWLRSPSDLPLKLYQSVAVYRHETKATKPLLRGREFLWIEAHDVFATAEEAIKQVQEDERTTRDVIEGELSVPILFLLKPQWDKFAGAVNTYAAEAVMPDGMVLQVATTHYLGRNFSVAFDLGYYDAEGKKRRVEQTCFGPGVSRILAAVVSVHGDNFGLVMPFRIAPVQAVIVPIPGSGVEEYARAVASRLRDRGIRVELDESEETPGAKYYKWEFRGVPLRIEVGEREVSSTKVTLFDRVARKRNNISLSELDGFLGDFPEAQHRALRDRAEGLSQKFMGEANSLEEAKGLISSGKRVLKSHLCSLDSSGEDCAGRIERDLGLSVRGELLNAERPRGKKCIACGREAKHEIFLAEAY